MAIPGAHHDDALPRPSDRGLYGTVFCPACRYVGLGRHHPEWCTWEALKLSGSRSRCLDAIELGKRVIDLTEDPPSR